MSDSPYIAFVGALKELFLELLPLYIGAAHRKVGTKIRTKEDDTPVVDLDDYSLMRLRALITTHFPEDITIGEEDRKNDEEMTRILANQTQGQWTIDGLDGTWHFIRGTNSYGAMISKRLGPHVVFSAIFRPIEMALRHRGFFVAERNKGAWEYCADGDEHAHRLYSARHGELERVTVLLEGSSKKFFEEPIASLGRKVTTRPSLSSCIAATTVARGDASGVVTVGHKPWDAWPIALFVEEAGGIVTDHQGNPFSPENSGNLIAAANPEEHAQLLQILNS